MRINKFVALATGISRRAADAAIKQQRVLINHQPASVGDEVGESDAVSFDGSALSSPPPTLTIMLHKPVGYVCSRDGQGSKTIYDLLPDSYQHLKPVGRLDKDSSGLLLLTNDGELAHKLTHPSFEKTKVYHVKLSRNLTARDRQQIEKGVILNDGLSRLLLSGEGQAWTVTMHEGKNRQIRRTFVAMGYNVLKLHRTQFGPYKLAHLDVAKFKIL